MQRSNQNGLHILTEYNAYICRMASKQDVGVKPYQSGETLSYEQSAETHIVGVNYSLNRSRFHQLQCMSFKTFWYHLVRCSHDEETSTIEHTFCQHHNYLTYVQMCSLVKHLTCLLKWWHAVAGNAVWLICKYMLQTVMMILTCTVNFSLVCGYNSCILYGENWGL